jgi:hypothetical protein
MHPYAVIEATADEHHAGEPISTHPSERAANTAAKKLNGARWVYVAARKEDGTWKSRHESLARTVSRGRSAVLADGADTRLNLDPSSQAIARALGDGKLSPGIRHALATAKANGLVCRVESGRVDGKDCRVYLDTTSREYAVELGNGNASAAVRAALADALARNPALLQG